jgi:alanyl-tRNA synthetase
MNRQELIKKYIEFFKSKGHKEILNSSLIPENDPTVLFTTAGMHPLVPYLLGKKHPQGKRLVNVQKCIRTGDIEEVGNTTHHTFFEMLGNWSLGDYWKKDAIEFSFEFLTNVLGIPKKNISITCFKGDKDAPKDEESSKIWESLGVLKNKIKFLPKSENWWGPAGKTGPCGPDTEMFIDNVEIWNDVFMQYNKNEKKEYKEAKQKNIDTGMGVERMLAILNKFTDNYLTEIWKPIIVQIEKLSKKKYKGNEKSMRIIADHIKTAVMILEEGITPSNLDQGYILRRLIRRAIRHLRLLGVDILNMDATIEIAKPIFKIYKDYNLEKRKEFIFAELKKEEDRFQKTLDRGLREFEKMSKDKVIDGKEAFLLYQSYGFPIEMIQELAEERKIKLNEKEFEKELEKHQNLSKTASAGKFKSGLADDSEATAKLHTATHMLNQALREVLKKPDLHQKGSNITPERLRFDFNFDRKLTEKEKQDTEDLVNKMIKKAIPIKCEEMDLEKAKKQGIHGVFKHKYGAKISVYNIKDFSKEICAGPHVENTKELGTFKITKEQSSSSGVRRIKAILK